MNNQELQLLSVNLESDIYGIDITKVQEIRALGQFRSLPNTPQHCVGVIDFRNSMVPVLDLRDVFGYSNTSVNSHTVMVVVSVVYENEVVLLGLVVDAVSDVITVDQSQLRGSPNLGGKVDTSFMQGMFKHEDDIVVVLTLEAILEAEDVSSLRQLVSQEKLTSE